MKVGEVAGPVPGPIPVRRGDTFESVIGRTLQRQTEGRKGSTNVLKKSRGRPVSHEAFLRGVGSTEQKGGVWEGEGWGCEEEGKGSHFPNLHPVILLSSQHVNKEGTQREKHFSQGHTSDQLLHLNSPFLLTLPFWEPRGHWTSLLVCEGSSLSGDERDQYVYA